jgi:hypothetical protein
MKRHSDLLLSIGKLLPPRFMDALVSNRTCIQPRHRGSNAALVKEYQLFRRGRADIGDELFALFEVGFAVALHGMERLFFRRRPNFSTRYQTRPRLSTTLASLCSLACNPTSVRWGCPAIQATSFCA